MGGRPPFFFCLSDIHRTPLLSDQVLLTSNPACKKHQDFILSLRVMAIMLWTRDWLYLFVIIRSSRLECRVWSGRLVVCHTSHVSWVHFSHVHPEVNNNFFLAMLWGQLQECVCVLCMACPSTWSWHLWRPVQLKRCQRNASFCPHGFLTKPRVCNPVNIKMLPLQTA